MTITEKEIEDRKVRQEIFNTKNENLKKLEQLFPSVVKDGQVDFNALKEELGEFEEVGNEKYGLTWTGKQEAKKVAQEDIINKTLKYIPEDSKNPDTTENLYIEGDNLEVLKLLRQNYYNSIKMIYIDPPYNTGNDFVYNDYYSMSSKESEIKEGTISELNERYTVNQKSSNKFHAKWLDMIYSRLKVAKDLLTDDGIIFVSIDDNESDNLSLVMNEVFSENNFIARLIRKTSMGEKTAKPKINKHQDYILVYCKNIKIIQDNDIIKGYAKTFNEFSNPDNDPKGEWKKDSLLIKIDNGRYGYARYPITNPYLNITHYPPVYYDEGNRKQWHYVKETFDKMVKEKKVVFYKNKEEYSGEYSFFIKKYKSEISDKYNNLSTLNYCDTEYTNSNGTKNILTLFKKGEFENIYPKPVRLIEDLISRIKDNENAIILDFFSGSATTGEAVMNLNIKKGGNRKYILVQIPEDINGKSNFSNICEIGKERIRRAGDKIVEENKDKEGIEKLDIGFKVFRVGDTNLRWNNYNNINYDQISLEEGKMSDKDKLDFMPGTKDIDVVYEILLRQRDIPLSSKIEKLSEIGDRTYIFSESYVVCLEENITEELINKLAAIKPLPIKFYFRDSAFNDDIELKDYSIRELEALVAKNTGEDNNSYTVEFI